MLNALIIGHLGADAEVRAVNDKSFVSFRVAHTDKYVNRQTGEIKETTQWVSCTWNGDGGEVVKYLKKGERVYVYGAISSKLFVSSRDGQQYAGIDCRVRHIELCGGRRADGVGLEQVLQYISLAPATIREQLSAAINAPRSAVPPATAPVPPPPPADAPDVDAPDVDTPDVA